MLAALTAASVGRGARGADRFSNPATLDESSFLVRMALRPQSQAAAKDAGSGKERSKKDDEAWKHAAAHGNVTYVYKGERLLVDYIAEVAGEMELHVWCHRGEQGAEAPREALPGSPFHVSCLAGQANASTSAVGGFAILDAATQLGSETKQETRGRSSATYGVGVPPHLLKQREENEARFKASAAYLERRYPAHLGPVLTGRGLRSLCVRRAPRATVAVTCSATRPCFMASTRA